MTPDEITPIDADLLAALLAADAARASGQEPGLDPTAGVDPASRALAGLPGILELIHRLEEDAPAAGPPPDADTAETPAHLGRFEVIREIGRGGFGVVYLARDPRLGREVAVKVPRAEVLVTAEARRRFLREGRAAAGLDHPHIIPVFEAGKVGPFAYIVAAYCDGPTLSTWLRERAGPVPARAAARLLADLADAVQHAHDRGVLHRDLKPSNILLQPGGEVTDPDAPSPRITDFGLARIVEDATAPEETRSGVPLGSPPYMAPEQAAGKRREVGAAADVYALGATLYEVITRRPPFQGESYLETLGQVLALEPVPPRSLRPGLPRDLEVICLKCLEKEPARRYASAGELREDLERFLRGEAIRARPAPWRLRAVKWVRRRPAHTAALVLVGMLASGLIGGTVYRDVLLQGHSRELEREIVRADANARLARRHLQAFQLRQARDALDARQVERAQDILSAIQTDRDRSDARHDPGHPGFAWHYLMTLARRELVVLSDRQTERVRAIALSPDGRTLATGDEDGTIRLRDPGPGRVRSSLPGHKLPVHLLAFAPGGTRLVSRGTRDRPPPRRDEILLWDLVSGRLQARVEGLAVRLVEDLHFGVDGRHVWENSYVEEGRRQLGLWDVTTDPAHPRLQWRRPTDVLRVPITSDGTIVALEEPGRRFVVHNIATRKDSGRIGPIGHSYEILALSPDGRLLAVGGRSSRKISVWDVATGREIAPFDDPRAWLYSFAFSPDSRYLISESFHGIIEVRDLKTGAVRIVTPPVPEPYPPVSVQSSPDGRFLATSVSQPSNPEAAVVWQLDPWRRVATYPGVPGAADFLFTPDGRSLILRINQAVIRWDYLGAAESDEQPAGHGDEAWSAAFSPDGSTLATGSDDTDETRTIKLWDVATGRLIRGWDGGRGTVAELAFAPRGRILASAHLAKPGEVRLWDAATGRRLAALAGHTDYVRTIAFSPEGMTLCSAGSDGSIRLWDVATGGCLRVLNGHTREVRRVAFSPDGRVLVSASNDSTVRSWEVATGSILRTFPGVAPIAAVAFAPDGRSIAAADENGMVSVWDVASGARLQSIASEHDYPLCLSYSPDGRSLAVAGKTRTIRLWDPVTGQELLTLDGHKAQVNDLAFSPDGSTLASCSHDGAVKLWRARPIEPGPDH